MEFKILRWHPHSSRSVQGFFDVRARINGFEIIFRDCVLYKQKKKVWVRLPSKKTAKDSYIDLVEFSNRDQKFDFLEQIKNELGKHIGQDFEFMTW